MPGTDWFRYNGAKFGGGVRLASGLQERERSQMRASSLALLVVGGFLLAGCADLNTTQQRVLTGGAIGAGVGTVGTLMTGGCVACGAAIGGAVGAGAGYVVDQMEKKD